MQEAESQASKISFRHKERNLDERYPKGNGRNAVGFGRIWESGRYYMVELGNIWQSILVNEDVTEHD